MKYWLSILVPSKNAEGFDRLISSLREKTRNFSEIQVVAVLDAELERVEYHGNIVKYYRKPDEILSVGKLHEEAYKLAQAEWIFFGNDDIVCETPNWDVTVKEKLATIPDKIGLVWPNDCMFQERLACFPIVSRKVLESTKFFPTPYRRYKIDDTIFFMIPDSRKYYLKDVIFRHLNDQGTEGFVLPDGRIYPIDRQAADHDGQMWAKTAYRRIEMRTSLASEIGEKVEGTRILIGVPTQEYARRADFYDYFNVLEKPNGSVVTFSHGQSPAKGRNLIIEQALANNCTHVLFIDDDTAFPPNLLTKLLSHDKDIVTALYLMRNYPHKPLIFGGVNEMGACSVYYPRDGAKGLVEIVNCGLGSVLIKTDVFKNMETPWIRLGELEKDGWCDDIGFFNRARAAGFKLYCDLDCLVGHMASVTIWPQYLDDKWNVVYDTNGTGRVAFPAIREVGIVRRPEQETERKLRAI